MTQHTTHVDFDTNDVGQLYNPLCDKMEEVTKEEVMRNCEQFSSGLKIRTEFVSMFGDCYDSKEHMLLHLMTTTYKLDTARLMYSGIESVVQRSVLVPRRDVTRSDTIHDNVKMLIFSSEAQDKLGLPPCSFKQSYYM